MRSTAIHDTLSKGSFSWIYLIIFIIKLTYYSAAFAQPQGKQMPDRDVRAWKPFLVDLKINQQDVPIPVGASVQLEGNLEPFVVGRDGLAYIEDLQEKNVIVVSWPENECKVNVPYSVDEGLVPYLGEFECNKENK